LQRIPDGTGRLSGYGKPKPKPKVKAGPQPKRVPSRAATAPPITDPDLTRRVRLAAEQAKRLESKGAFVEVERRASVHIAQQWHRVVGQPSAQCLGIARFARLMLNGHDRVRAALATAAEGFAVEEEKDFVNALVRRLPLPGSAEIVIAARTLQLAGIVMCATGNVPLRQCPVLIDVVTAEGRELIKPLITEGATDWTGLTVLALADRLRLLLIRQSTVPVRTDPHDPDCTS